MKIKNSILLYIIFIYLNPLIAQKVYVDSIAPKVGFTNWINLPSTCSDAKKKPTILEFWSTWCGTCIKAIPHLNKLSSKYKEHISFISVNSYEDSKIVTAFLKKHPMKTCIALDENKYMLKAFNIQNIPTAILIDKDGMLRWRGIASDLTEELLDTFLIKNKVFDIAEKGFLFNETTLLNIPRTITYNLSITYGNKSLAKSYSENFGDKFFLGLKNYSIYNILTSFTLLLNEKEEWIYEGNLPDDNVFNIDIESNSIITGEDTIIIQSILEDVIKKLANTFNFDVEKSDEKKEIWFIKPDTSHIANFISANQSLDVKKEESLKKTKYENVFFKYLEPVLSRRINKTIKYPYDDLITYSLTIPKTKDVSLLKDYLYEHYKISLIQEQQLVKINKATFH